MTVKPVRVSPAFSVEQMIKVLWLATCCNGGSKEGVVLLLLTATSWL